MRWTFHLLILLKVATVSTAGWAQTAKLTPLPPACPDCCESMKPYPGISADDLMKIETYVKYTKFAKDYKGTGFFQLVDKKGFERKRDWGRFRILLNKRSDVFDYKDLLVILAPQNIKGMAILTWTYLDPVKNQDVWLWLPSLRKVRRISQSEADDPVFGSDFTTEEMSTRKWEDETYTMIGEKRFSGYSSVTNGKTYYQDKDCYVVEAIPRRKDWYYSKRIVWLDKDFAGIVFEEVYDSAGREWKTFMREYGVWESGCIPQIFLEGRDGFAGHVTAIMFEKDTIKFNSGLEEGFFTEKTLMRSKW